MVKELGIGAAGGVLIILAVNGINILPVIFLGFLAFFLLNFTGQKGLTSLTGNSSKEENIPQIEFDEIGGQETAKNELIEGLEFIRDTESIKYMGIRPLKGILLSGPPGTGKTLMARAAAKYTDSIFKATSGSEFIEMYAGVGAKRIRKIFSEAKKEARKQNKTSAIIFIDEIDILGGKRGQVSGHREYDQTLNQLLVEMDGLSVDDDIQLLIMATTNRQDILDSALLRPGRFDRIVQVDLPAREGRLSILKIHTTDKPLAENVDLDQIARETFRFSGAHLENLTNEAAIMALREDCEKIKHNHFQKAIDKIIMGEKLDRRPGEKELKRIAIHETGHALISELLKPGSVSTITITSRGKALGYVRHNPEQDRYLQTEDYIRKQISISIAGGIAEEVLLNSKSTGAKGDYEKALNLVEKMVTSGMTELGVVNKDSVPQELLHRETSKILEQIKTEVLASVQKNRKLIDNIAAKLVKQERFSGDKLRTLL
ncbi:MAG: AAA family ATPase [Halanaerobiales bacterium]